MAERATPTNRRRLLSAAAAAALVRPARAQEPPGGGRAVRVVVPSAPGAFDTYARIMAPRLTELLGAPVVIDNRPGANGNIGMAEVQRAAPDGLTVLFAAIGSLSINTSLYRAMPLDPIEDLLPVALPVTSPMVWVAGADGPLRSLADVVAAARAAPGRLSYALPGSGTVNHLIVEAFKLRHGLDMPAVPYRGTAAAQTDMIAGTVPLMVDSLGAGMGHISGGRLRPLALTAAERSSRLPAVPTAIELGLEEQAYIAWYAFMAPKGTPEPVVARLNAAINAAATEPAVAERIRGLGADTQAMAPAAQGAFMRAERDRWAAVVRAARVEVQ
jgi:tripartite-type tricarboxylate transporter receptor subunit TctC